MGISSVFEWPVTSRGGRRLSYATNAFTRDMKLVIDSSAASIASYTLALTANPSSLLATTHEVTLAVLKQCEITEVGAPPAPFGLFYDNVNDLAIEIGSFWHDGNP